jgi:hypothetical protein
MDDAGRHGDFQFAGEPLELHVLDACLAEGSRLRLDVPEEKREELVFLSPKVDTLFAPESLLKNSTNSLAAASRAEASPSAAARRTRTRLHESIVMVAGAGSGQGGASFFDSRVQRRPGRARGDGVSSALAGGRFGRRRRSTLQRLEHGLGAYIDSSQWPPAT